MQSSLEGKLEHDFTDDLPVDVALQYRILKKLLPSHGGECQHTDSAVSPFRHVNGNDRNGSIPHSIVSPCYLPPQSMVGFANQRRVTDYRQPPISSSLLLTSSSLSSSPLKISPGSVTESTEESERTLCEIERGGPILDQLVQDHLVYTQLYSLLKNTQKNAWDSLFDYETNQRDLIEKMSECTFDNGMLLLVKELLLQLSIYSKRTSTAEARERQLQSDMEELWLRNQQLKEQLRSIEFSRLSRVEGIQEQESTVHALEITQEELQMSRQIILELQQQLKDNEVSSKEALRSMMSEVEELKLQYCQLVNSQSNSIINVDRGSSMAPINTTIHTNTTNVTTVTNVPEFKENENGIMALRMQVEQLRHQLSLKDASINILNDELAELREVSRELGASQARVRTLERRLSATRASSGIRG